MVCQGKVSNLTHQRRLRARTAPAVLISFTVTCLHIWPPFSTAIATSPKLRASHFRTDLPQCPVHLCTSPRSLGICGYDFSNPRVPLKSSKVTMPASGVGTSAGRTMAGEAFGLREVFLWAPVCFQIHYKLFIVGEKEKQKGEPRFLKSEIR